MKVHKGNETINVEFEGSDKIKTTILTRCQKNKLYKITD